MILFNLKYLFFCLFKLLNFLKEKKKKQITNYRFTDLLLLLLLFISITFQNHEET